MPRAYCLVRCAVPSKGGEARIGLRRCPGILALPLAVAPPAAVADRAVLGADRSGRGCAVGLSELSFGLDLLGAVGLWDPLRGSAELKGL